MGAKRKIEGKNEMRAAAKEASHLASEIIAANAVLRSISISRGLQHPSGGGVWSLLSILSDRGSLSIRDAAMIRDVSRQYMIKLANQLEADGVLELDRDGPETRGFQMHLTAKGKRELGRAIQQFEDFLADRTADMEVERLRVAIDVVADFAKRLTREP
jgi:DNA-binding MarR family transcriptional regulator